MAYNGGNTIQTETLQNIWKISYISYPKGTAKKDEKFFLSSL